MCYLLIVILLMLLKSPQAQERKEAPAKCLNKAHLLRYTMKLKAFPFCLSAQYAVQVCRYLKEWYKNPKWSFSCCVGLLLPLSDLSGEMHDFEGANNLTKELEACHIEMPINHAAAKDLTPDEDQEKKNNPIDVRDDNCENVKCTRTKCHQETQTEPLKFAIFADKGKLVSGNETMNETR